MALYVIMDEKPSGEPRRREPWWRSTLLWTAVGAIAAVIAIPLALADGWFEQEGPTPPSSESKPASAMPSPPRANTATLSLPNGLNVGYCVPLFGAADLASGKSILTAHRRVNPPDATYYFDRGAVAQDGRSWSGREYLGSETGQEYEIYVLIMDAADANVFWEEHLSGDQSFAFAKELPTSAADVKRVTQTTTVDCP